MANKLNFLHQNARASVNKIVGIVANSLATVRIQGVKETHI